MYLYLVEKKPTRTVIRHTIILTISLGIYLYFRYGIAQMYSSQDSIALIRQAGLGERLIHIPLIIFTYLKTFFYPLSLTSSQFWFIDKINAYNFYLPLLFDLVLFSGLLYGGVYVQKKSISEYQFFFLWFILGLALHLQIYPLDMTVAERWFYFPSIGLIGMLLILYTNIHMSHVWRKIVLILFILVVLILAYRTYLRNYDWKDAISLYSKDLQGVKGNYILENALATEYINRGEFGKAKPYSLASVKTQPFFANLNNLAIIYVEEGKIDLAKTTLREAFTDKQNFYVYENYAHFLLIYDTPQVTKIFTEYALTIFPRNARLWIILAQAEYFLDNEKKALDYAKKAVTLNNHEKNQEIYLRIKQGLPIVLPQKKPSNN